MKFLDFFAGIGGFRLGMEMAGHECVGHCEIDKYANKSYIAMHQPKEDEWFADNIRNVQPGDLPEADCYCFGFPCQAFSVAGNRGGFEDTRGTLFFEVMRLAAVRKPKYLFAENVAGLLSHDGGRTFGTILRTLGELGYWWEYQVLNSKDFEVPQNRERVFIIGHLGKRSGGEVFPITGANSEVIKQISGGCQSERIYAAEGLSPCLDTMQGGNKQPKVLLQPISMTQKNIKQIDVCQTLCASGPSKGRGNYNAVPGVLEVRAVLTPDRVEKRQNGRRIKDVEDPMFTLTAQDKHGVMISKTVRGGGRSSPYGSKQNWDTYEVDNRIRRLTPRECFRLQGFKDIYFERAAAVNSDSQLYKQAGNSVTVNVVYEIGKRLEC
jgi:DNA (cytosine-5)-methyltransferase 1